MKQFKFFIIILLLVAGSSCSRSTSDAYKNEIAMWRKARIERLKSKNGWLNLAGLYWLKEGENTFGSDSSNSIIFPPEAKKFYGSIIKAGDSLSFKSFPGAEVVIDGEVVSNRVLHADNTGKADLMESANFAWLIIKRDTVYGIRLRNYEHPRIAKFDSIPAYETSAEWKITAQFIPFDSVKKIETATMIGTMEVNNCPGELVFRKGNKKIRLLPFSEGNEFFIIFADKTNGITTYGNGRFMYAPQPDSAGKVTLDFNKAYNPPCAFSPFATCPMPPRENMLDIEVEAGEKEVHEEDVTVVTE